LEVKPHKGGEKKAGRVREQGHMGVANTKERRNSNNDELPSEFLSNSLNELQILEGHKDIVRLLVVLDHARCLPLLYTRPPGSLLISQKSIASRIASASDDGSIMIWNYQTGEQIFVLAGHTRPITCLLLLDLHTLISGSSDRTIRISFPSILCLCLFVFYKLINCYLFYTRGNFRGVLNLFIMLQ
jgi:WD40 repeat protein